MSLAAGLLAAVAFVPWILAASPPLRSRARAPDVPEAAPIVLDVAVGLDLVDALMQAGASAPGAVTDLGRAIGGPEGDELAAAGSILLMGGEWSQAWAETSGRWDALAHALEPAWADGVDPGPMLRAAAEDVRASRADLSRMAAARLGVRLVLPLGLCLLPAFALLGLAPVVIATAGGLWGAAP